MIDKDGKLFGKVNIIDLFIILAVLAVGGFLLVRLQRPEATGITIATEDAEIKFFTEQAYEFVAAAVLEGDRAEDEGKGIWLGRISNVDIGPGYTYGQTSQGQVVKALKEGYSSLEITTEIKGQFFENGILINGNKYSVGHGLTVRAGKSKIYMYISDIQKK
jgi:hypothetical protein